MAGENCFIKFNCIQLPRSKNSEITTVQAKTLQVPSFCNAIIGEEKIAG